MKPKTILYLWNRKQGDETILNDIYNLELIEFVLECIGGENDISL